MFDKLGTFFNIAGDCIYFQFQKSKSFNLLINNLEQNAFAVHENVICVE